MKANELRCGNYVNVPRKEQSPFRVDYFDRVKVYQDNGTYECPTFGEIPMHPLTWDLSDIEGIVLTPEILEKCGFYYKPCGISGADMWQGMGFWYRVNELPHQEFLLRGDFSRKKPIALKLVGWFNSNIEYLHQLQNLYWCLCGEELDIKL